MGYNYSGFMKYLCLLIFFALFSSFSYAQTSVAEILKELGELPEESPVKLQKTDSSTDVAVAKVADAKPLPTVVKPKQTVKETDSVIESTDGFQIYRVKKGDNPWTIARQFKVNYKTLLELNNIKNPKDVQIGQKFRIPNDGQKNTSPVSTVKKQVAPKTSYYLYTMKPGEDPWTISRKLKVDYKTLLSYNQISDPTSVKTGRKFKVPK